MPVQNEPVIPLNQFGVAGPASPASYYAQQTLYAPAGGSSLRSDYAPITADALATRDRNMARIDQYGASQRSDLAIQNTQALAAARQSAISRGLGNTTIQDSLVRGQNFDNTRQVMNLEDQLLKNRISTDSDLSNNYQDRLQSQAQGLASQWSTTQGIYAQGLQMANANQQAAYGREQQYAQMANANQQAMYDRELQLQLQRNNQPASGYTVTGLNNNSGYMRNASGGFGPAGTTTNTGFVGGNNARRFVG